MAYGGPYIPNATAEKTLAEGSFEDAQRAAAAAAIKDPNIGKPTSFWGRMAQDGASKTMALLHFGKQMAVQTGDAVKGTAQGIARELPGGMNDVKAQQQQAESAANNTKMAQQQFKAGKISKAAELKIIGQSTQEADQAERAQNKTTKSMPTTKELAGDVLQTAALAIPGAGKASEEGGAILLRELGAQGVRELASKAGMEGMRGSAIEMASAVAKSDVGKQALGQIAKQGGKTALKTAAKTGAKDAGAGAAFGAGQGMSANQNGKGIVKSALQGAALGGGLGAGGSLFKAGVQKIISRYKGGEPVDVKGLQQAEQGRQAANKMADEKGLPQGAKQKLLNAGKSTPKIEAGSTPKGLPEGKPTGGAKPLEGTAKQTVKTANDMKVAQMHSDHVKAVGKLNTEFDQVTKGMQKSDHVVTKEKVQGYNSTRQLQQDHADQLKSIEDSAKGGEILKKDDGTYSRSTDHSQFYRSTFADKGRAPTKAEYMDQSLKELKSGKAGDASKIYQQLKDKALQETDQRYSQKLDSMESAHQAAVKEASTPTEKGFTVSKEPTLSPAQKTAQNRVSQIDKVISAAQKNGTTKSADDMRTLMRERKEQQAIVDGKPVVKTPVTKEDMQRMAGEPKAGTPKVSQLGGKRPENAKQTAYEEAHNSGNKSAEKVAAAKLTDKAMAGESMPQAVLQEMRDAFKAGKPITRAEAERRAGLGEGGYVAPGAVSKDIKAAADKVGAHIEQSKKTAKFSGDIAHDADIHTGMNKYRMGQSAKLMEELKGVSKADREAVFNYREAKAAGTKLPELTDNQKALHDVVTKLTKAANENKAALADMKAPGYSRDKIYDPEAGNHRIALGKGSALERFGLGRSKSPFNARSLRTGTASGKARVYHAITDENGHRSVAVVKNVSVKQGLRSVSKGKYVTAIDENGVRTQLGKIKPSELNAGEFKGSDGKTYKVGQATADEISRATGQKYFKDPLTSAVLDYHETTNAVESARMLEKWKSSSDFENVAMKQGEGTPPKGWTTTRLPQMNGYVFEPKVAHVLDDIYGNIKDKAEAISLVNHTLRTMMVAIPIRHNLNEIGFYFTDRGASSLINPMAYKRGAASLVKAVDEVMNQGPLYRQVVSKGFNFMYQDDKAFSDAITAQTKSMLFDDEATAQKVASDMGTTVVKLRQAWNAVQHKGVWFQQDVLNLARIIERTDKGMSLEEAVNRTARFNPQYRVPSTVAGSRFAAQTLKNNNLLFFGSYHYDQWKVLANSVADLAGKNGGKAALEAADKFGALALGVWATHALIDKGLQNFSGNNAAYTKPFGVLDLPDELYQMATGKKTFSQVAQSQIFPSAGLNTIAQVFENRDFFTGSQIYDPNMPKGQQVKQIGDWLNQQMPYSSQIAGAKSGKNATGAVLSIGGAKFPKNTPATDNLYSLRYDTLPNIQTQARKQAQAGNVSGAQQTISQYDKLVLNAAKNALKSAGKPVPDDQTLIKQLKAKQYYYAPKQTTIQKWSTERPQSIVDQLSAK